MTEKLLEDLRNGKEEAYREIFSTYFQRLCNFAFTYVSDREVTKNLVQDAFIKLWENRQGLRKSNTVISYLLSIVKNNCLDYLKRRKIELKYQKQSIQLMGETELNYYALKRLEIDMLDYHEIEMLVEKTLLSLPPQCQQVFRMSRFENLTNREIAEQLGIGQKAVEANITRAIKVFRHELKDYISILILLNIDRF